MNLKKRIEQLCEERGISVRTLEKMAGLKDRTVQHWDKSTPSFDKVQRVLDALEISYVEFADIGLPETQKQETELVKLRIHFPEKYEEYMKEGRKTYEEYKKMLGTQSDEQDYDIYYLIDSATDKQKELIQEVLRLPEQQVSAFLSLAKSLPGNQDVQGDPK